MKLTKRIAVIYTIANGRKSYLAQQLRPSVVNRALYVPSWTADVAGAREFTTELDAEDFIPKVQNNSGRPLLTGTAQVCLESQQKRRAMQETPG